MNFGRIAQGIEISGRSSDGVGRKPFPAKTIYEKICGEHQMGHEILGLLNGNLRTGRNLILQAWVPDPMQHLLGKGTE